MQTTVDIDDAVLHAAEDRARKQGKPLSAPIEEALRMTVKTDASFSATPSASADEELEENDLFFATLEEIRALGRLPTPHREVRFH